MAIVVGIIVAGLVGLKRGRLPNEMALPPTSRVSKWFRMWAELLDSRFRVPGTSIRFGIDPILSLIPGVGELASPLFTAVLFSQALRQRVPRIVLLRMAGNALLDALIGAVPIVGNVGDIFWRANTTNLALVERHARPGRPPSTGDYVFVLGIAAALALMIAVPVLIGIWLGVLLWRWIAAL
jgi:uncharacterized protein DUF4112